MDMEAETMRCVSCLDEYDSSDAGTCKECYEEADETEEELKREIDELKAKVSFLRLCSPLDHHQNYRPSNGQGGFTDVLLVATSDQASSATPTSVPVPVPVPAHKALLVSTLIPPDFYYYR